MKNPMNNFGLVPWLALFLCFSSCQDDFEKVGQEGPDGGILAHSPSAALIGRASAFDGSYDNVVDGAGCFAIKFPYTINLNGEANDIRSKKDLLAIQEKLGLLIDGRAQLDLVFPVRLTLGDFSEILVENQEALARLALDCMEVGEDRIGCIEFIYPITLFTLEVESQRAGEATVDSDLEMRRFFAGLDPGLRVSLQFPVQLKKKDGSILEGGDITEWTTGLGQAEQA